MTDASRVLEEHEAEPAATPAPQTAAPAAPAVDDLDDLVEDVSIDGMCGVY